MYVPKNILITGGAGFIGSHVASLLVKQYPYKVVVYDKLDYCASLRNLEDIQHLQNYKFVKGDILSTDLLRYVIQQEEIDTILHFAAQSHVDRSFGNSLTFTTNNVLGTHILLEVAKECDVQRFIHVSTDECYGEVLEEKAKETASLLPNNPYAASKAAAEMIARGYYRSFGLPVIITRGNNVYGPRQYPEKLIPKFLDLISGGKPCTIHGKGDQRRTFVYAEDVAKAFVIILHKGSVGEVYNVGSENEYSVLDIARMLYRKVGVDEKLEYVEDRPFNDTRYLIDSSKVEALGWINETSFDEGLDKTIRWYKEHPGYWCE